MKWDDVLSEKRVLLLRLIDRRCHCRQPRAPQEDRRYGSKGSIQRPRLQGPFRRHFLLLSNIEKITTLFVDLAKCLLNCSAHRLLRVPSTFVIFLIAGSFRLLP